MGNARILTPADGSLIPSYLDIFNRRLDDLSTLYPAQMIQDARETYTSEFMREFLSPNDQKRFVGHFTGDSLDGLLIEGFDSVPGPEFQIKRTLVQWVMAQRSGQGVGTYLVNDSVQRATEEGKDAVSLVVSTKNPDAERLYRKLGFVPNMTYHDGALLLMHNLINPKLR